MNSKNLQKPKSMSELSTLYGKYIDPECFLNKYLAHLSAEYDALTKQFPGYLIDTTARIKSPSSYFEKVYKHSEAGKSLVLGDIFANKYILYSMNGNSDEENLIRGVYSIRDFLAYFNSKFENASEILSSRKDYISSPKKTSQYKSLHLTFQSLEDRDLRYETQIKTFRMRQAELIGPSSHHSYYKPLDTHHVAHNQIPIYIEPSFLEDGSVVLGENGLPLFRALTFNESKKRYTEKRSFPYNRHSVVVAPPIERFEMMMMMTVS